MDADRLESVVNIGPKLAAGLRQVGVQDLDDLRDRGAVDTWEALRSIEAFDCASSLLALEGAVRGIRWHVLPESVKADLTRHVRATRMPGAE